jgi:TonB family protein
MQPEALIQGRRRRPERKHESLAQISVGPAVSSAFAYPGYAEPDHAARTRAFLTGSALVHGAGFAVLLLIATLAPAIEEHVIQVQLLKEEPPPPPPPPDEPAAAPKALAQRRNLPFAPAVQAVAPQIVNPRIIAEAKPAVAAEALQMDALSASAAPTEITARTLVVERVSVVNSAARAVASPVDVRIATGPVVRGPTHVEGLVGPSVGPRRVEAAAAGTTMGTGPLQIGSANGSSVKDGVLSDRDVIGSPDGALVVSVDTAIGDGLLAGNTPGGTGTSIDAKPGCLESPAVKTYLSEVRQRTYERWVLPPGVDAGRKVTLRFHLDIAGSASKVSIVKAEDNALGASAVDALRAAAPFPPMPEEARCLSQRAIVGTFSNPVGG